MGQLDGSTLGGPLKLMNGTKEATREVFGIPIGPFSETNLAVSQTSNDFAFGQLTEAIMQYGGYIVGLSIQYSAAFTAVPPTFTVTIDGVDTAMVLVPALVVTEAQTAELTDYTNAVRFERGAGLSVVYDSAAGMLPAGSIDVEALIWIA
jgi:uncharacterized protein (DUF2141 family)